MTTTVAEIENSDRVLSAELERTIGEICAAEPKMGEMVRVAACDSGVRLLPFLLGCSYHAGGGQWNDVARFGVAIEFLKSSALAVDDILDNSSLRNGQFSLVRKYGVERAICAAAFLSATAFDLISREMTRLRTGPGCLDVVGRFAEIEQSVYRGQTLELERADATADEDYYLKLIQLTTAVFIRNPLVIGAILWDAPAQLIEVLHNIGNCLGMAYQLRDDVIDVIGDPSMTGKAANSDIRERKMRLPLISALLHGPAQEAAQVNGIMKSPSGLTDEQVDYVAAFVIEYGGVAATVNLAIRHCDDAAEMSASLEADYPQLSRQLVDVSRLLASLDYK